MQETTGFKCPTKTGSGLRALDQLPSDLASINASNPLLITDRYHSEKHLKTITSAFRCAELTFGLYDGISSNSDITTVSELVKIFKNNGFDSIIALGPGKIADIAKILNIALSCSTELKELCGKDKIKRTLFPFVYIPVLRSEGFESSSKCSLNDLEFDSSYLMPNIACIDYRIIDDDSPVNIIGPAFNALTVASEDYTDSLNPFSGSYSHIAIEFVMENLKEVVIQSFEEKKRFYDLLKDKDRRVKKTCLVNASVMAGYLLSNKEAGIAERLGEKVSEKCGLDKGVAMGIILPYSLEYKAYRKNMDLEKYMLPVAGLDIYCNTPKGQRFESAIGKIRYLINELYSITSMQIPRTLEDAGLKESDLSEIAKETACEMFHEASCFFILEHAFYGKPVTP